MAFKTSREMPKGTSFIDGQFGTSAFSGMLLQGPSGVGKTMLAHSIIQATKLNYIIVQGLVFYSFDRHEIYSKYLGETEEKIRSLFSKARQLAPCILLWDDLDLLTMKRGVDWV